RGEVVEDVEDLERGNPARRARGQGEIEVAVTSGEWRAHARLVPGEVVLRQEAAARGHLVVDRLGDRAPIEGVRSLARDQGEAPRQVRVRSEERRVGKECGGRWCAGRSE